MLAEDLKASSWEILFRVYKRCLSAHYNLEQMSVSRACFFSRHRGLWKFYQEKNSNTQWKKWCLQTEIQMAEKPKACSPFQAWAYVFNSVKCDMHSQSLISSQESVICDGNIKHRGPYPKELTGDSEQRTQMTLRASSTDVSNHAAHLLGKSNTLCHNLDNQSTLKKKKISSSLWLPGPQPFPQISTQVPRSRASWKLRQHVADGG